VQFRGRTKEMVKTGGINVAPAEVEALLQSHPTVRLAAVVGIPDPQRDEVLAALVVLQPGAGTDAEALRAFCRARAAVYKVPAIIEIVADSEMPLTDTGKISKRLIQERFAAARVSRSPAG
jgi:fatty-acyl-CoA synthase